MDQGIKVNDEICYCYYCKGGDKLNLEKSHVRIYETDLDRILVYTLKRLFLSFHQEDKGLRLKTYLEKVSAENENGNGIDTDTQFKTLYYDLFSKELSEKVRGAAKQIKSQGKNTNWAAPFGYIKDPEDKYHIIIDKKTDFIVKEAFTYC